MIPKNSSVNSLCYCVSDVTFTINNIGNFKFLILRMIKSPNTAPTNFYDCWTMDVSRANPTPSNILLKAVHFKFTPRYGMAVNLRLVQLARKKVQDFKSKFSRLFYSCFEILLLHRALKFYSLDFDPSVLVGAGIVFHHTNVTIGAST